MAKVNYSYVVDCGIREVNATFYFSEEVTTTSSTTRRAGATDDDGYINVSEGALDQDVIIAVVISLVILFVFVSTMLSVYFELWLQSCFKVVWENFKSQLIIRCSKFEAGKSQNHDTG